MSLYISPQDLKSSEFLSCPSQVTHSLQLWDILTPLFSQLPSALLPACAAQSWTPHSSSGLANMLQRGRVTSHVLQDLLLFIHWNMTFFYVAWDCWLIFNLWSSRTSVPFPNWTGFQPHNLSCDTLLLPNSTNIPPELCPNLSDVLTSIPDQDFLSSRTSPVCKDSHFGVTQRVTRVFLKKTELPFHAILPAATLSLLYPCRNILHLCPRAGSLLHPAHDPLSNSSSRHLPPVWSYTWRANGGAFFSPLHGEAAEATAETRLKLLCLVDDSKSLDLPYYSWTVV